MGREEPAKKKVRADPHRVMAWVDSAMQRPPLVILLVGVVLITLTILISPKLWHSIRIVTQVQAGKRAEGNIKATRTFEYMPDPKALAEQRKNAAKGVHPVFDHQEDLGEILSNRIKRAFNELSPPDAGAAPAPTEGTRRGGSANGRKEKAKRKDAGVDQVDPWEVKRRQFASILQIKVTPRDFERLKEAKSPREVRGALLALVVEEAMKNLIIDRRLDLTHFKKNPMVVRHMKGDRLGRGGEETINNLGRIKDEQQVREDVLTKADVVAAKLPQPLAKVLVRMAQDMVMPNLSFNSTETNARITRVQEKIASNPITVVKGQVIVHDGDAINAEHMRILEIMEPRQRDYYRGQVPLGAAIFLMVLLLVHYRYARREFLRFYQRPRDLLAMSVILLGLVGLSKSVVSLGGGLVRGQELPIFLYAIPLASGAMLVRLLISAEAAALFAAVVALVCGFLMEQSLGMALFYLVTGLVAGSGASRVQSRSNILRAGLWAGIAGAGVVIGVRMFREVLLSADSFYAVLACLGGGLLIAFMTLALLPAMEWLFAYTTDVTLLELANLNHPLLRDLILRAPGTYHHSMIVGNLSEAACEGIGANGLLARVASYYHDIGKVKNSEYFAENLRPGDNPHNRLKPSMSALIIRSHVKDTIEMLKDNGLPELVINIATQHHGKTLIEFFYHKAKEHEEHDEEIHEEDYRYPGPKPQSREAGVLLLADGVEAAARSLAEPTEDRLQGVVQRVINTKFTDGQLDHCDLTLRDLHLIAKSFLQVLRGIYHQRPTYPWQRRDEGRGKGADEGKRDSNKHKGEGDVEGQKAEPAKPGRKQEQKAEPDMPGAKHEQTDPPQPQADLRSGQGGDGDSGNGKPKQGKSEPDEQEETRAEAREEPQKRGKQRTDPQNRGKRATGPTQPEPESKSSPDTESDQPPGERPGPEGVEPGSAQEVPTDSGTDLKRLGL